MKVGSRDTENVLDPESSLVSVDVFVPLDVKVRVKELGSLDRDKD